MFRILFFVVSFYISAGLTLAEDQVTKSPIGVDEKLGNTLPLHLKFLNDRGQEVQLKNLFDKPTILMFVYYECPGLCTPLMSELAAEAKFVDLVPGKDYKIVSVSIDPEETPELAAKKKVNYLKSMGDNVAPEAWEFLTGDSASIAELTDAAGFRYMREGEEFIHGGALILISPQGKISRYLLGTDFLPFDIKMAIVEASEGKVVPTIAKMLKFCYSYDREGKRYVLNVTRVAGSITILFAIGFIIYLTTRPKKKKI